MALVVAAVLAIGGLWLWGRPRASVAVPGPSVSPAQFVRTYARALNERDYSAAKTMLVGDRVGVGASWWTLHGPQITDISVTRVGSNATRGQCDPGGGLDEWKQCLDVGTTATFRNWSGITYDGKAERTIWSYYLVRNSDSERWRIIDWGQP